MSSRIVTYSLPEETIKQIDAIRKSKKGRTKSGVVEYAVDELYKKEVSENAKVDK
ncbi:MAG TPA: hypothetical protein GXZ35_06580 [Acholeplasmataceae bacterium]|nr:hypothetical protein [Acholeplasmataceae bacterium]